MLHDVRRTHGIRHYDVNYDGVITDVVGLMGFEVWHDYIVTTNVVGISADT